jgi:hypothetical protein
LPPSHEPAVQPPSPSATNTGIVSTTIPVELSSTTPLLEDVSTDVALSSESPVIVDVLAALLELSPMLDAVDAPLLPLSAVPSSEAAGSAQAVSANNEKTVRRRAMSSRYADAASRVSLSHPADSPEREIHRQ